MGLVLYIPCAAAFKEKKIAFMVGPYRICPKAIFFNVERMSRFGRNAESELYQT